MKKLPIGLVIEGNSTSSAFLRLSSISAELGAIKSSSLQVARRVSNSLRGGNAVNSYAELNACGAILIRVPDAAIHRVVTEICTAGLNWQEHAFVLCETWVPTERLEPLRRLGSEIASIVALPTGISKTFAMEGDPVVIRHLHRLIERTDAHGIELRIGAKHLLFAATALCTAVPLPILVMAQQVFRDCGLSGNEVNAVIGEMSEEMLTGFLKGARMTWGGPISEYLKSTEGEYWDQLDVASPELSGKLRDLVELGRATIMPKLIRGHSA